MIPKKISFEAFQEFSHSNVLSSLGAVSAMKFILVEIIHSKNLQIQKMHILCQGESSSFNAVVMNSLIIEEEHSKLFPRSACNLESHRNSKGGHSTAMN